MRSAGTRRRLLRERIALDSPDPQVSPALQWAIHTLEACRSTTPDAASAACANADPTWTTLALLACGGFDAARATIRGLATRQEPSGRIPHPTATGDASAHYLLLVARELAWTGDTAFVREQWPNVRRACSYTLGEGDEAARTPPRDTRDSLDVVAFHIAALHELAVAAESIGDGPLAESLRRAERAERHALDTVLRDAQHPLSTSTAGETGLAVPLILGAIDHDRANTWHDQVQDAPLRDTAGLVSWAEYAAGRAEAAFRHWWPSVEQAARLMAAEEKTTAGNVPAEHAALAARLISPLVHGLLGAVPDAVRYRLELRPQLPKAWQRLDVVRLRMADAEITLRYHREGDRHTFRLAQESGAVPATVAFEPMLAARRLAAARVDGHPADLDPRPHGERMVVPVQLVLDNERTIELDVAHDVVPTPSNKRGQLPVF